MNAPLSVPEQVRASDPRVSAWVVANAGSGKTRVLVARILRLLLAGVAPAAILCLTFTRAAAVEMHTRLFEYLSPWVYLPESELRKELHALQGSAPDAEQMRKARTLFAKVLDTPEELRIQTIHSFCERLLGRFPIEAGVPAQFRVLDEHQARKLRTDARNDLLRQIARHRRNGKAKTEGEAELAQAIAVICADITERELTRLLDAIDNNRQDLDELLPSLTAVEQHAKNIYPALGLDENETTTNIEDAVATPDARADLLQAASVLQQQRGKTFANRGQRIEGFLSGTPDDRRISDYFGAFFTANGAPRKSLASADMEEYNKDSAAILRDEQERLQDLRARHAIRRAAERSRAVLSLSHHMLAAFACEKKKRGALDFDDLIEYAARLLSESHQAAWVLYKLDEGISHILIDEAQDTSPRQWQVITALAQEFFSGHGSEAGERSDPPRSIFAVGDEKQSIFRFQGADLDEYDERRKYFAAAVKAAHMDWREEEVKLLASFRSKQEVLDAVDWVFEKGEGKPHVSKSGIDSPHKARHEGPGLVELWQLETDAPAADDNEESEGGESNNQKDKETEQIPPDYWNPDDAKRIEAVKPPRVRLAQSIAAHIRGLMDSGSMLSPRESDKTPRAICPGGIMILVQRRDAFVDEMIRALKQHHIPVAGTDRMRLGEHLAVMDLLSLGRACLFSSDDLSLAETLKSPLFGLDDDDLFTLAYDRQNTLWHSLCRQGEADAHLGGGKISCRAVVEHLKSLRRQAGEKTPFTFYHSVLLDGGWEQLLHRLGRDAADPLDAFLDRLREYERLHPPSLQGFLHWLQQTDIEIKRDRDRDRDEVRVMTVHAAKGLEADIVFLPDTCRAINPPQHDPVLFFDVDENPDDPPLLWQPSSVDESQFSAERREGFRNKECDEDWRLLYVAMTRARERLYICGHIRKKSPPADCWYARCLEALQPHMREITQEDGQTILRLGAQYASETGAQPGTQPAAGERADAPPEAETPAPPVPRSAPPLERAIPSLAPFRALVAPPQRSLWKRQRQGRSARQRGIILHEALRLLSDMPESQRLSRIEATIAALAPALPSAEEQERRQEMCAALRRVLDCPQCQQVFQYPGGRNEVALGGLMRFPAPQRGEQRDGQPRELLRRIPARIDRLCFPSDTEVMAVEYKSDRRPPDTLERLEKRKPGYLAQLAIYCELLRSLWPQRTIRGGILWIETADFMEIPADRLPDVRELRISD